MANIRIQDLPNEASPSASDEIAIDGLTTRKTTLENAVAAGRPVATQPEAEAGVNNTKAMTPLTTKQAIDAIGGAQFATSAQGGKADTALQPSAIGSSVQAHSALLSSVSGLSIVSQDLIVGSGAGTVARLPKGTDGQVLSINAGNVAWRSVANASAVSYAPQSLSASEQAQARNNITVSTHVDDRTALKALDPTKDTVAYLKEAGREGVFVWRTGDYSTQVAADTQEGIYIKADGVAATVGAWVRQYNGGVNPRWFGVAGDGVADDTAALQAFANFMCRYGGKGAGNPKDKYRISGKIVFKPQVSAGYSPPYNPPSDIIFDLVDKPLIDIDLQGALIVADAAMGSMFELVFSAASPNEVAPFFIRVHHGRFNGAGNATIGIHSNWCLGSDIDHNLIWGVARGIKTEGYGLHTVSKNVIRFTTCGIDMTVGGADSLFRQNDFYTASGAVSGAACFLIGNEDVNWPGQTRIFSNAATNEGQGTAYFVKVEASVSANVVRNVNVLDNGVTGFDRLIYARGKSGSYNLRYWVVRGNNTLDYDAKTTLGLIDTTETEGWLIDGNFFNPTWSATRSPYNCIQMANSVRDRISGNYITMCSASGIRVDFANRAEVTGNKIFNCGDATNAAIGLASSSQRNLVYGNTIDNNDTTNFCQIAIAEGSGGDWNAGSLNMINNVNAKYSTVGANTVFT